MKGLFSQNYRSLNHLLSQLLQHPLHLSGIFNLFTLLLSTIVGSLALWILIPAPIFQLLPLSVGVSEISPWLITGLIILIPLIWFTHGHPLSLLLCTLALGLSVLPLIQFPAAHQQATLAMQASLGADYLRAIPATLPLRSAPLIWQDCFRGIPVSQVNVRHDRGIEFAQVAGVPLRLNVYRPASKKLHPTIVMIYGGAWHRGSPDDHGQFSEYMAAQGYTVVTIDYRHAPQFRFPAQLADVRSALTFIKQHADRYEVDLSRVVLMGRSAGAHLAMLAGFQSPPLPIRAVVSYYGPVDLVVGYHNPPVPDPIQSRPVLRSFLGGSPQEFPDLYQQASPYYNVTGSLPISLLIYGQRDHVVQSKYGRAMAEKLRTAGNKSVLIEIPWADHAFDAVFQGLSNQLALYHTERFLAWVTR
jgi:acetyl esterase/lipase